MKITLDLPDDLLIEAKAVAARRGISLKAMIEHALRREIQLAGPPSGRASDDEIEYDETGLPRLKRRGQEAFITSQMIYQLTEEEGV